MTLIRNVMLALIVLLNPMYLCSDDKKSSSQEINSPDFRIILNKDNTNKEELIACIPESFVIALHCEDESIDIEFLPKNEHFYNWSETISISIFDSESREDPYDENVRKRLTSAFLENSHTKEEIFESSCRAYTENGKDIMTLFSDMQATHIGAKLDDPKRRIQGKNELFMLKVIQASNKTMFIRYAIRYNDSSDINKKEKLTKKMHQFLDTCLIKTTNLNNNNVIAS